MNDLDRKIRNIKREFDDLNQLMNNRNIKIEDMKRESEDLVRLVNSITQTAGNDHNYYDLVNKVEKLNYALKEL